MAADRPSHLADQPYYGRRMTRAPGRTYYDHEPAYQRIAAAGGTGWDDLSPEPVTGSYRALDELLASPFAPERASAIAHRAGLDIVFRDEHEAGPGEGRDLTRYARRRS